MLSAPLLNLLQTLGSWDRALFEAINSQYTNSFFDQWLPYVRNMVFWMPLYLFVLVFFTTNFKGKGWWWVLFFLVTVSLTDIISSQFFKEYFQRTRPCNDPFLFEHLRLLADRCSGGYSFTSSHAANHSGLAFFFYLTTRKVIGKWSLLGFPWAALVGYAQIYVGVHYPFDILGGIALGAGVGTLIALFFNKRFGFTIFDKEPTPHG